MLYSTMLKDRMRIKIQSGKGGAGSQATFANKAYGGDGGDGGNVIFEGSRNLYDLGHFELDRTYKAQDGKPGEKMNKKGANGQDLILKVPLVTEIHTDGQLLDTIKQHGQQVQVLTGGLGGYGNTTLRKNRNLLPQESKARMQNKTLTVELVLKLQSDVIFIGYPNAGKSSMLNALTNAKVKTAPYAFTTIDPQIGLLGKLRLMDLPGLIEGTHEGKGLGIKFAKHTENSRLVLHFVALDEPEPTKRYLSMREEIKKIGFSLADKPEIIVLSKSDEVDENFIKNTVQEFRKITDNETLVASILDDQSIETIKNRLLTTSKTTSRIPSVRS